MGTSQNVQAWLKQTAATSPQGDTDAPWTEGQDPATVNNYARSNMSAIKKKTEDTDGGLAAGGTANALTVTTNQVLSSGHVTAGLRLLIRATADNTSATVTFAPDGLTAANIKRADGSALAVGSIKSGMYLDLVYNSGSSEWRCANIAPVAGVGVSTGQLFGLTLSNDSGGTTAIAIAAGSCRDSTDIDTLVLSAAITAKTLGTAWAVGSTQGLLDTGVVANSTYHIYLIKRPDTGVVDVIASTSASAPTLPANYTLYRRVGSIIRSGGAIVLFNQLGDTFLRLALALDINTSTSSSTAVSATLSVPTGVQVDAVINSYYSQANGAALLYTSPDQTDVAASSTMFSFLVDASTGTAASGQQTVRTNTSAQIRYRQSGSSATIKILTAGWIDRRGRV